MKIDLFGETWLLMNGFVIVMIIAALYYCSKLSFEKQKRFQKWIAYYILVEYVVRSVYVYKIGAWEWTHHLPFHVCSIASLFAAYLLLYPKQKVFERFYFWAILGALLSLFLPDFPYDEFNILMLWEFYIHHGIQLLVPILLLWNSNGLKIHKRSWIHSYWSLYPIAFFVSFVNAGLGANYMFLKGPPNMKVMDIIPREPWILYFTLLAIVMISGIYLVNVCHHLVYRKRSVTEETSLEDRKNV